jgi:hypothetical protein
VYSVSIPQSLNPSSQTRRGGIPLVPSDNGQWTTANSANYRNIIKSRRAYVITLIILIMFPCRFLRVVFMRHSAVFLITLITFGSACGNTILIRPTVLRHRECRDYRTTSVPLSWKRLLETGNTKRETAPAAPSTIRYPRRGSVPARRDCLAASPSPRPSARILPSTTIRDSSFFGVSRPLWRPSSEVQR